eukprot:6650748-Alexandrium_andersonii.AAC.2
MPSSAEPQAWWAPVSLEAPRTALVQGSMAPNKSLAEAEQTPEIHMQCSSALPLPTSLAEAEMQNKGWASTKVRVPMASALHPLIPSDGPGRLAPYPRKPCATQWDFDRTESIDGTEHDRNRTDRTEVLPDRGSWGPRQGRLQTGTAPRARTMVAKRLPAPP